MRPVRRRLRMPIRLFPRVGERPAGADMGVIDALDRLLAIFRVGDFGFRMDRGREEAALIRLYGERPSLLANVGTEVDLARKKVGGLKKLLLWPSGLDLARLDRSRAGSRFSKSLASKKSAALRLPGEETEVGIAVGLSALLGSFVSMAGRHTSQGCGGEVNQKEERSWDKGWD